MTDDIDRAQAREQQLRDDALSEHRRRAGIRPAHSMVFCASCGSRIPDERRAAVPGCRLCVDCQQLEEKIDHISRQRAA